MRLGMRGAKAQSLPAINGPHMASIQVSCIFNIEHETWLLTMKYCKYACLWGLMNILERVWATEWYMIVYEKLCESGSATFGTVFERLHVKKRPNVHLSVTKNKPSTDEQFREKSKTDHKLTKIAIWFIHGLKSDSLFCLQVERCW